MMFGVLLVALNALCLSAASARSDERASDPLAFANFKIPLIPIGPLHEPSLDDIGAPISQEELLHPLMIVDPSMETVRNDPIEKAGLFEGDIVVRTVDEFLELTETSNPTTRIAVRDLHKLWPEGKVPYVISSSFDQYERGAIAFAMKEFQDETCIRFKGKTDEEDYIHLIKADGCSSSIGRVGGPQVVSLGEGCLSKGVVLHELMHCLGFWHEQARPDRDRYITIIWNNIRDGLDYNFGKQGWNTVQNMTVDYDLGSIMHYGFNAFSKNLEKPTIIPNNGEVIGQRYGLSEKDILKIKKLYKCNGTVSGIPGSISQDEAQHDNLSCKFWASNGECANNNLFMMSYCKKACKEQKEKEEKGLCLDSHSKCRKWAREGQCQLNAQYMLVFCEKSCGKCKNQKGTQSRPKLRNGPPAVFHNSEVPSPTMAPMGNMSNDNLRGNLKNETTLDPDP